MSIVNVFVILSYAVFNLRAFLFIVITARIRRMGEGTVFSLFVSSLLDGGGVPHLADEGDYPSFLMGEGGGVPSSSPMVEGVPLSGLDGVTPL